MRGGGADKIIKTLRIINTETDEIMCKIYLMEYKPLYAFMFKWKPEYGYRLKFEYDVKSFEKNVLIYVFLYRFIKLITNIRENQVHVPNDVNVYEYFYKCPFISYSNELKKSSDTNSDFNNVCDSEVETYVDNSGNILDKYKTASIVLEIKPTKNSTPDKPVTRISIITSEYLEPNTKFCYTSGEWKKDDDGNRTVEKKERVKHNFYKHIKDYDVSKEEDFFYKDYFKNENNVPKFEMSLDTLINNITPDRLNTIGNPSYSDESNAKKHLKDAYGDKNTIFDKMKFVYESDDNKQNSTPVAPAPEQQPPAPEQPQPAPEQPQTQQQ